MVVVLHLNKLASCSNHVDKCYGPYLHNNVILIETNHLGSLCKNTKYGSIYFEVRRFCMGSGIVCAAYCVFKPGQFNTLF